VQEAVARINSSIGLAAQRAVGDNSRQRSSTPIRAAIETRGSWDRGPTDSSSAHWQASAGKRKIEA